MPRPQLTDDNLPETDYDGERMLAAAAAAGPRHRRPTSPLVLAGVGLDLVVAVASLLVAGTATGSSIVAAAALLSSRAAAGLHRHRTGLSSLSELPDTLRSSGLAFGLFCVAAFVLSGAPDFGAWIVFFSLFTVLVTAGRALLYAGVRRRRRSDPRNRRRTAVLGAGLVGEEITLSLLAHPELGLEPVGFVDSGVTSSTGHPLPMLTSDGQLRETLQEHEVDTLVIAYGPLSESHVVDDVIQAVRAGCQIMIVPRLFELQREAPGTEWINGIPLVRLRTDVTSSPTWWIKGAADRTFAALGIVLLSPLLALLAVAVVIDSGRPVLFRQTRVGGGARPIEVFKFRSLRPADENESQTNWNIKGDPRMTRLGALLRRSSLDELPQLFNVLRGDMSIVGPRPERPAFVQRFSADHPRYWARHRVPVGLTGWSQVNGLRGDTSISHRARYDNFYIANWSLWLDVRIVLLTLREVVRGSGG